MAHARKQGGKNVNTRPYTVRPGHNPDPARFKSGDIVRLDEQGKPHLVAKPKKGKK